MKKGPAFTFDTSREGIEARLSEMELKIDRLRSMYESYFMGQERMPPASPRREMNRLMLEMQQVPIANASLRFRFQALSQKWVLHVTYWNRTLREIDAGIYRRDLARAQRHLAERGGVISEEEALALGIPKNRVKAFVARQQRLATGKPESASAPPPPASGREPASQAPVIGPPSPGGAAALAPKPSSGPPPIPAYARRSPNPDLAVARPALPGLSEPDFESAYASYLAAHHDLGTVAAAASKEKIRARLGQQLPRILAEQGCERVRIEVAVEAGKVRLRAWPAASGG